MVSETPNLKLKKPGLADLVNIDDLNGNMDKLDTAVSGKADNSSVVHKTGNDEISGDKVFVDGITNKMRYVTAGGGEYSQLYTDGDGNWLGQENLEKTGNVLKHSTVLYTGGKNGRTRFSLDGMTGDASLTIVNGRGEEKTVATTDQMGSGLKVWHVPSNVRACKIDGKVDEIVIGKSKLCIANLIFPNMKSEIPADLDETKVVSAWVDAKVYYKSAFPIKFEYMNPVIDYGRASFLFRYTSESGFDSSQLIIQDLKIYYMP